MESGRGLFDVQSPYDTIEWAALMRCALLLEILLAILNLELLLCFNPRTLGHNDSCASPFAPARPIIQGIRY
eukprot:8617899-Pyramimonas_sp.AAC.1